MMEEKGWKKRIENDGREGMEKRIRVL